MRAIEASVRIYCSEVCLKAVQETNLLRFCIMFFYQADSLVNVTYLLYNCAFACGI